MADVDTDSTVSYRVADLFDKVDRRFDQQDRVLADIDRRMDGMATREDVKELHQRLDGHEGRIKTIEDDRHEDVILTGVRRSRWKMAGATVTAVLVPFGVALIIVFVH